MFVVCIEMGEFTENLKNCPQLMIYLGLSFLSVGTSFFFTNSYFAKTEDGGVAISSNLFMHLFQVFVIGAIFYYLCKYNYQTAGWVLLLFPVIISMLLALMFFGLLGTASVVTTVVNNEIEKKTDEKDEKEEDEGFKGFDGKYETSMVKI
jgi:hypothetical protein